MGFHAGNVSDQKQAEEAHSDSPTESDFMQAMSVIKIKESRCTQLTSWMGFHAGHVSERNQAEEVHTTHGLDGISNVSDQKQAEEVHSDSQSG